MKCHMATSPGKESGRKSEMQLSNHYVDDGLQEVTCRVQCNQTLWLPPGAVASCLISLIPGRQNAGDEQD